ncbi:MAG: VWA domain-containing protein [Desulfomonilaceae bacterium]|nr:VWA domain-containing protein [Desulfomonilaceae bacterium]
MSGSREDGAHSKTTPDDGDRAVGEGIQRTLPCDSLSGAIVSFGRLLKENGIGVTPSSIMDALRGVRGVGVENFDDFKTVLRTVFLSRVEEFTTFDRLFSEVFRESALEDLESLGTECAEQESSAPAESSEAGDDLAAAEAGASDSQERQATEAPPYVVYSPREILRNRDFRDIPAGTDPRMARLIREILSPLLRRIGVRRKVVESGTALDFRRMLRKNVRYGGELVELPRLKPKRRIRRLVFLCDVSGSMNPYLWFMLRFIKELQQIPTNVETFVFATRLNRITPLLVRLPFARAMEETARTVKDWSGGTRIGACLQEFTSFRGGRMLGASTIVLIHSDGWDRGDSSLLQREMAKIRRRSYRVLWINPLLGGVFYEPTCKGMKTALPFVDSFLPGHNVSSLERVAGTLRGLL